MGWIDQTAGNQAVVLKPERVTNPHGTVRGVLWSDTAGRSTFYGFPTWIYFHFRGHMQGNGVGAADSSALSGQNCAWSDGSVQWTDGLEIDADPAHLDTSGSYKNGAPGSYYSYSASSAEFVGELGLGQLSKLMI